MECTMQKLNDLSRSLGVLEPDVTLIAVIEMSLSSWLVAGIVPGVYASIDARARLSKPAIRAASATNTRLLSSGRLKPPIESPRWVKMRRIRIEHMTSALP